MTTPRRWAAIPAQRSSAPLLRIKLRIVLGLLLFAATTGPIAFLVSVSIAGSSRGSLTTTVNDEGVSYGAQIVRDHLSGNGTSLPVAAGIDTKLGRPAEPVAVGVPIVDFSTVTSSTVDGTYVETYTYNVTLSNGVSLQVAVPLTFTEQGPLLVAVPSLLPAAPFAERTVTVPVLDWSSRPDVSNIVPQPAATAVRDWATAYFSGEAAALQRLTGDQDPSARYLALSGVTFIEAKVTSTFPIDATTSVARVQVLFSVAGVDGYRSATEFDLLIADPTLPNPRVQAWGPSGSGPTLKPYQNNTNNSPTPTPGGTES